MSFTKGISFTEGKFFKKIVKEVRKRIGNKSLTQRQLNLLINEVFKKYEKN